MPRPGDKVRLDIHGAYRQMAEGLRGVEQIQQVMIRGDLPNRCGVLNRAGDVGNMIKHDHSGLRLNGRANVVGIHDAVAAATYQRRRDAASFFQMLQRAQDTVVLGDGRDDVIAR